MIGQIISDLIKWFEEHHTVRKTLKHAIFGSLIAFVTVILDAQTELINSAPDYAVVMVMLFALLNGLLNWLKHNI